ncbi:MAG: Gfo/Idh/MocA family oxidoreductase [Lachnospiraceae bacterium]|nr:Gfo/Idh/MocA family oxidoreductase [Lachnospiraceae bacterium]
MENIIMKVGVIGAGSISEIYLKNMIEVFDNLEVVAVSSKGLNSAKMRAEQFGIQACTNDELLANPEIEMVVVLTPAWTHYDLIKQALLAGKHVYTEKTITDSPEKAAELCALAEEKGLYLGSAPDTFLGSALQCARKAIDDGMLGEIHSFSMSVTRNNDLLLSIFSFLREPGGGILYDYAVYYMTALVSLLGPVAKVGGIIGHPYPQHVNKFPMSPQFGQLMDTPNESQVSAIIQLENGITGTLHIDADSLTMDEAYFAIYGTKGVLYATDPNQFGGTVKFLPNALDPRVPTEPITLWQFTPYHENSRGIGPSDLAAAIREGRKPRASKEMAAHVLEVLTGILNAGDKGGFTDITSTCERPAPLMQQPVGAKNLAHASFNMKNTEAMVHFYQDVLGMKEQFTLRWIDVIPPAYREVKAEDLPEDADPRLRRLVAIPEEMRVSKWLSYFKLADGQFIEVFYPHPGLSRTIENRWDNIGYLKLNFEVDSIEEIREILLAGGVSLDQDIHPTMDGSREIVVHDPDGNEVQFTEYSKTPRVKLPEEPGRNVVAKVSHITQVAYQVKDGQNMLNFYTAGLGFTHVDRLTFGDLARAMEQDPNADPQMLMGMKMMGDQPWLDYIEVAPHQFIELFYTTGQVKKEDRNLQDAYGYQHICIEVEDIHAAWDAVKRNGLTPDTEISLGADGAYQFWLVDPDGNRLELMQYTENAKQLG